MMKEGREDAYTHHIYFIYPSKWTWFHVKQLRSFVNMLSRFSDVILLHLESPCAIILHKAKVQSNVFNGKPVTCFSSTHVHKKSKLMWYWCVMWMQSENKRGGVTCTFGESNKEKFLSCHSVLLGRRIEMRTKNKGEIKMNSVDYLKKRDNRSKARLLLSRWMNNSQANVVVFERDSKG